MPLRLIFMGTPEFAVPTLAEIAARHDIAAVRDEYAAACSHLTKVLAQPVFQFANTDTLHWLNVAT